MILASYKGKDMSCCGGIWCFGWGRDTVENVALAYYVHYYNKVLTKPERDAEQNFIQIREAILSALGYTALCRHATIYKHGYGSI